MAEDILQVQSVDHNLQAIRTIEGSWALPALPDEVKLDIASDLAMTPPIIASLLGGLGIDVERAERRQPFVTRNPELAPQQERARMDLANAYASVVGLDPPRALSADSVTSWKRRATELGYLDLSPEDQASQLWLPEFNGVNRQMSIDQMTSRFQGDKPASLSVDDVGNLVEKWLTPKGLFNAAVALDMWWDAGNIASETQAWGQKWVEWRKDPTSPMALIDALTGPIDDLVFPVINWALMFTGVGGVYNTGRALYGVGSGVKSARMVAGMYRAQGLSYGAARFGTTAERMLHTADVGADIQRFAKPGFLSSKLAPGADDALLAGPRGATSAAMNAWRDRKSVVLGKKATQQVMRMGFASNLQASIDDAPGQSLASLTPIDDYVNQVFSNPIADWAVDLLFTPTNVFEPGAFLGTARAAGRKVEELIPMFRKASENEQLTLAFHAPMQKYLEGLDAMDGGSRLGDFNTTVRESGMQQALANQLTNGDKDQLGAAMSFVSVMAVVDANARATAHLGDEALQVMSVGDRTWFHHHRNNLLAQLRYFDEDDTVTALETMSRYGSDEQLTAATGILRGDKWRQRYTELENAFLEDEVAWAARGGAVPDGHVRLYGRRDEYGEMSWSADAADGDPFIVDVTHRESLRVLDPGDADGDAIVRRYMKRGDGDITRHFRLSEAGEMRVYDQDKLENLRVLVRHHNQLRQGNLKSLMSSASPQMMEQYVYETLPSFGRWSEFNDLTDEIAVAAMRGDLDNVKILPAVSEPRMNTVTAAGNPITSAKRINLFPADAGVDWTNEISKLSMSVPGNPEVAGKVAKSWYDLLARDLWPGLGRVTVADVNTVTKQEALLMAHRAARQSGDLKTFRSFKASQAYASAMAKIQEGLVGMPMQAVDTTVKKADSNKVRKIITGVLVESGLGKKRIDEIAPILVEAHFKGLNFADLEKGLHAKAMQLADSPLWSGRYQVGLDQTKRYSDPTEILDEYVKGLRSRSNFLAAEVEDAPAWLQERLASATRNGAGYKLVYGVEYALPHDLRELMPEFADVGRMQVNSTKLRAFFGRQEPEVIRSLKARAVRSSLATALAESRAKGGQIRLNVSVLDKAGAAVPQALAGVAPKTGDLDRLIDDLWEVLHSEQATARMNLDKLDDGGRLVSRVAQRAALSQVPMSLERLPSEMGMKPFVNALSGPKGKGYSVDEATAIYRGLQKSQALGFKHLGLYHIEAKLRSEPNLTNGLRLLGRHRAADSFSKRVGGAATQTGGFVGGAALVGNEFGDANPDASFGQQAGMAIAGGLAGKAAGSFLAGKAGLIGASDTAGKLNVFARGAEKIDGSAWGEYSYLTDKLAQMRDLFRFSLNPVFDASRYSEAVILSQLEYIPDGIRLRANQSPRAYRRYAARQLQREGMSAEAARAAATAKWDETVSRFASAAKGDFDWETIDSVGRRFSSTGILGFSPANWMASTYGHLVDEGLKSEKAYELVRDMYTYGRTGRSAAELSMNFVFFPFSFTKKTLGHMTSAVTDDLSRLVITHDALATYQLLNEEYDLTKVWDERLPILGRMHRMNLMAYGIGPGRFGGINAQLLELGGQMPVAEQVFDFLPGHAEIINAFVPQGVTVSQPADADDLWDTVEGLFPVWNDVNQLIGDLQSQGRVIASENHMTYDAEVRRGWEDWRQFQSVLTPVLESQGMSWAQGLRHEAIGTYIRTERAKLQEQYPGWEFSMADGASSRAALDLELKRRTLLPLSTGDEKLVQFHTLYEEMNDAMRSFGSGWSDPETIPPDAFGVMRNLAVSMSKSDPEFLRLYNRFYRQVLGDITMEIGN